VIIYEVYLISPIKSCANDIRGEIDCKNEYIKVEQAGCKNKFSAQ
jgi:hypothetical protein